MTAERAVLGWLSISAVVLLLAVLAAWRGFQP